MKNFRCMLLCFTLLSAVSLMAGCSCGNPQDETTASFPAETSSVGQEETSTQGTSAQGNGMDESSSQGPGMSEGDIYETGNGTHNSTGGYEDGAGSMGTDEGILPDTEMNGTDNGTDGGLMEDVTDGLDQMGDDITDALDDTMDGRDNADNR